MSLLLSGSAPGLAVCGAASSNAEAQVVVQEVGSDAAARDALLHARYADAIGLARRALAGTELTAGERTALLEVVATAAIANRDEAAAASALEELYRRDPGHRLLDADASPVVQAAFARARQQRPAPQAVEARAELEAGDADVRVQVHITAGADAVASVRLAWQPDASADAWTRLELGRRGEGLAEGRLPLPVASAQGLVYFVELQAPSGHSLASLGSRSAPRIQRVRRAAPSLAMRATPGRAAAERSSSILESPWFWTATAVVLGGATASYFLVGPPSGGPSPGSLGQGGLQ